MDTNVIIGIVAVAVVVIAALVVWGIARGRAKGSDAASDAASVASPSVSSSVSSAASGAGSSSAESTGATAEEPVAQASGTSAKSAQSAQSPASSAQKAANSAPEQSPASEQTPAPAQSSQPQQPAQTQQPAPQPAKPERPESSGSRIQRLRAKLANSSNPFGRALFNILSKDNLSESDWEDVEDTLLLADVGAEASEQLVSELRKDARITGKADAAEVRAGLRERLLDMVGRDTDRRLNADKPGASRPGVIIMVGVNGTGKTTTAGKLARLFVADGKKVVMGAADTFRAAAADQLETWGARVNVPVVRSDKDGADPASVAFEAAARAKEADADVLIIDTAGRLQNKANLMDELGKIRRVTEKQLPVDEVLLVLDATTGQNGMTQAKVFAEAIGITGVVLSKLDGSAKGGIVISVQKELGVPVKLVGLGEGPDDLAPFDPEGFVDGILA
ncbi:signal recognition particle-docking protein FtsY [Bifidobacterium jacchi]|uniref:Signal recognition particle receptor FtsY n=1 Tax=Bifidobacterium jacchi TaxID=2490545 RepID=A0A5N5RLV1_9BIFI|nr:signal recognition particle-docking protein FtsY [Bifidobacterium jacchi]KAB5607929.1 signal recognition particle-docking protein FtsY [Bifidobacterium jacchi]